MKIPKANYITKYKDRAPGFLKAQKLLTLSLERQFRCGDGGTKGAISHSFNCECERIDKEIKELEANS